MQPPRHGEREPGAGAEWRQGWPVVVAASLGVTFGFAAFINTSGLFVIPMQQEFGWSRGAVTMGPLIALAATCLNPFVGILSDRYGARRIALSGLAAFCLALVMIAVVPANLVVFYAAFGFAAVAATFGGHVVFGRGVATWFTKGLGSALGITMSVSAVIFALMLPLLASVIENYGWRAAYLALAAFVAVFGLAVGVALFRQRPVVTPVAGGKAVLEGMTSQEAMRCSRFWILGAAIFCAALPSGAFLTQLQPILVQQGHDAMVAAAMVSIYALAVAGGRLVVGYCLDRFPPKLVSAACLLFSALGAAMLWGYTGGPDPLMLVPIAVFLIGLAQGAELNFAGFFAARMFGLHSYGVLFGILASAIGGGMTIGGYLLAFYFDFAGEYRSGLFVAALSFVLSAVLILLVNATPQPRGMQT